MQWTTRRSLGCIALWVVTAAYSATPPDREEQLKAYVRAASASLEPAPRDALVRIVDSRKRLLALTYYLRAGKSLASRWSWTEEEIKAYVLTDEWRTARAEVKKIQARFAADNPKYSLYANMDVRSLEVQIRRWEEVRSVQAAADLAHSAALKELSRAVYPAIPDDVAAAKFTAYLAQWRPPRPPSLAAPGMSLHGRGRAFDFQVKDRMGRIVAGTDTATVDEWDKQGWTAKLENAVRSASAHFIGPLKAPREPWHYEYRPSAPDDRVNSVR